MVFRPVVKCAPESAEQRAVHKASCRIAKNGDVKRSPKVSARAEFVFIVKKTTHLVGVILCRGREAIRERREVQALDL